MTNSEVTSSVIFTLLQRVELLADKLLEAKKDLLQAREEAEYLSEVMAEAATLSPDKCLALCEQTALQSGWSMVEP
jgi:hypothetical protein